MKKNYLLFVNILISILTQMILPIKIFGSNPSTPLHNWWIDIQLTREFPTLSTEKNVNSDLSTFHFYSHGRPGQLLIEGKWLNQNELAVYFSKLITSTEIKHLNIYGCEFAKGEKGLTTVKYLENKLGISVSASTNITGTCGDWELEVGYHNSVLPLTNFDGNLQWTIADTCPTCDFDGDGIINSVDIDDDNDGVPDTFESCVVGNQVTFSNVQDLGTGGDWTTLKADINMSGVVVGTVSWKSNTPWTTDNVGRGITYDGKYLFYTNSTGATDASVAPVVTGFDGALLTITPAVGYSFSGNLNFVENANYSGFNSSGDNGYSSGGNDNSGTFTHTFGTNADGTSITATFREYGTNTSYVGNYNTGDNFNNTTPIIDQQNAQPQGTSGGSISAWGAYIPFYSTNSSPFTFNYYAPTNAVAWETNSINFNSLMVTCDSNDTDGDGIANQFDLDSDGDGCPDAVEASVSGTLVSGSVINTSGTSTVGNAVAQGTYGANGLANSLETNDNSTAGITYNNTYSLYALDSSINFCSDNDGDNVSDYFDLDDDNDGILDADESPSCFYTQAEAQTIVSITSDMITETYLPAATNAPGTNLPLLYDGNTTNAYTRIKASSLVLNGMAVYKVKYNLPVSITSLTLLKGAQLTFDLNSFVLQGSNDNSSWLTISNPTNDSNGNLTLTNTSTSKFKYYRVLDYAHISGTNGDVSQPNFYSSRYTSEIRIVYPAGYIASANPKPSCTGSDTDIDGIANYLDLDSDGDGCTDAIEGSANITSASLFDSSLPGGNSGADFLGRTTIGVIQNLGNDVDANGVPMIATSTGQSIGSSQDVNVQDINCLTLPVKLLKFDAQNIDCKVNMLNWVTATEVNSEFFEIERSEDGKNFELIGKVEAAHNSTTNRSYQFKDNNTKSAFYRLKMVNIDKSFEYSEIIFLNSCSLEIGTLSPNPATTEMNLELKAEYPREVTVSIFNALGQLVLSLPKQQLNNGQNNILINVNELPNSTYFLKVDADNIPYFMAHFVKVQ